MSRVDDLRKELQQLDPEEWAELMRSFSSPWPHGWPWPTWPSGIETSTDDCGGEPRIVRTRIPVWVLEQMRRLGSTEADILRSYPTLRAEDLVHAWAYVDFHRDEIDEQIRANEEA